MSRDIAVNISLGATLASSFSGSLTTAQAQVRGLATALRASERSNLGQVSSQRERMRGLGAELRTAETNLAGLRERAQASGESSGYLTRQIANAERQVSTLSGSIRRQGGAYRGLIADMRAAGESTSGLRARQQQLAAQLERTRNTQAALSSNLAARQGEKDKRADLRGRVLETAATAAMVAIPAKLAISAEDTFADLKKVLPDMDDAGIQQIFDDALAMSAKTGKSIEDVLAIMTAGAQAGLGKTREEMLGVTEQALQMSVAWGVPAETAGKSLATWQASMGLTMGQSKELADTINVLSDAMNAEAGEINEITTRMGPMLKDMGFGTRGIAAYSAAIKAAGADVDVTGTALKNLTKIMVAGKAGLTKERQEIFQGLGIDPDVLAKQMTEDAEGATLMVLEALNTLPQHEKMSVSMRLMGDESIAAIAPLLGQLHSLKSSLKLAQGTVDGSVFKEYQNRMSTAATAGARLTQNVRGLGIEIGTTLLPAVKKGFAQLNSMVSTVRGLAKDYPGLTRAVVYGASALVTLSVAGLVGSYVFSGLKSVWLAGRGALLLFSAAQGQATLAQRAHTLASLSWRDVITSGRSGIVGLVGVLGTFTGIQRGATLSTVLFTTASNICGIASKVMAVGIRAVGMAFNLAFGPVGLLIGALTIGAGLVIDNWDTVGPYFGGIWNGIVGIFQGAWNLIKGIVDKVVGAANWVGETIDKTPVLGSAKRGIGKAWDWTFGDDEKNGATADAAAPDPPAVPEKPVGMAPALSTKPAVESTGFWGGVKNVFGFGGEDNVVPDQEAQTPPTEPVRPLPATSGFPVGMVAANPVVAPVGAAVATTPPAAPVGTVAATTVPVAVPVGTAAVAPSAAPARGAATVGSQSEVRVPQAPSAAVVLPQQSKRGAREAHSTSGATGASGATITVPMTFNVQGLDAITFKRRIEDCRQDFESIVRRVVGDMEHAKARTAYVPS